MPPPDPPRAAPPAGLPGRVREACAWVAGRARHVHVDAARVPAYAAGLPPPPPPEPPPPGPAEHRAAFVLTLDAVNFGSGWWPTVRKRPGHSGFATMHAALRERFASAGPPSPAELRSFDAAAAAALFGQDAHHELMALYAAALRELGERVAVEGGGRFLALVEAAGDSAVALAERLASWPGFADASTYDGRRVPFFKRAQIAAADLAHAGVARFADLERLTIFADNLVPHVLRLDGVLRYDERLAARIEAGEPLAHGSAEEVEIRALAVHAAELICAARPDLSAEGLDRLLWTRGRDPRYKARPRHRSRTTAY